jgi:hypothetical protein
LTRLSLFDATFPIDEKVSKVEEVQEVQEVEAGIFFVSSVKKLCAFVLKMDLNSEDTKEAQSTESEVRAFPT